MMADWRDGLIPIGQNSAPNDGAALADPAADNWRSGLIPIGGGNDTTAPSQSSWMPQPTDDERFLKRMQEAGRIQNPESAAYAPTALRNVMRDRMGLASEYDANEMAGRDNRLRQRLKLDGYDDAEIDDMPANVWEAHRQANETDPRERQVNFATNELEDRLALSGFEQPEHQKEWPKEMTSGADNLGEPLSVTAMKALTKKKYAPSDESVIQRVGKPLPEVSTTDAFKELESLRTEAYQRAQRGKLMDPEFLPKLNAIERLKSELEAKYPEFAAEKGYKSFDAETTKWLKRSANANEDQFNRDVAETRKNWNAGIGGDFSGSEAGGLAVGIGTGSRSLAATAARGIGATINATGAPGINVIGDALSRISDRLQYGNRVLNAAQQQAVKEQQYGSVRGFLGENLPGGASSLYQAAALAPAGMAGMTLGFGATTANDAYYQAKQEGLSEEQATKHAIVQGGIEMAVMTLFNKFGKLIPGLEGKQGLFAPAAEKIARDTTRKQVRMAATRLAGENLEEVITSALQQVDSIKTLPSLKKQDVWTTPGKEPVEGFLLSPGVKSVGDAMWQAVKQTTLMMGVGEAGRAAILTFSADPSRKNYYALPREIREQHHLPNESSQRQRAQVAAEVQGELDLFTESQATSPALQPTPQTGGEVIDDGQEVPEVRQDELQVQVPQVDAVAADGAAADDGFSLDEIMGLMPRAEDANEGTEADAGVAQDGTQPTPVISPAVSQESPIENAPTTSGMQSDAVAEPAADVQPASSLPAAVVEAAPVDAPVSAPASGRSDADRREFRNGVLEGRQPEFDADDHREWQGSDEYVAAIAKTPRLAAMSRVVDREAEEWLKNNPDDESGPPMTRKERELDRAIVRVIELSGLQVSDGVKRHLGMPPKKSPPPSVAAQPSPAVEQSASGVPGATSEPAYDLAILSSDKRQAFVSVLGQPDTTVTVGAKTPAELIRKLWDKYGIAPTDKADVFKKPSAPLQAGAIPSDAAGVPASPPASASKAASSVAESSSGAANVSPQAKAQSDQPASQRGDQQVRDSSEVVRKRERRSAKLKPDEQAVSKSVDETIKRAERVAEQHSGSPHGDELKAVVEVEKRNRDAAVIGTETTIKAPGMGDIPARFGLLDISQVIASHDFTNGQANSASNVANGRYPSDLQPRNYDAGSDNYEKVVTNARQFDERELLADSAYATVGPSVVTPQGIVLNGNGRTMTLQLARYIGKGERYQQALRERLSLYGLTEADAAGMEFPVLVRIVDFDATSPQAKQFAEVGNISVTQAQSPAETARKLSSLLPANIVKLLRLEGEETFAEAINGKRFLDALRESWPPSERANYFDSDGTLTAAGKDIVRNTLLQRIAPLKTLEQLTDAQSNLLASAIPQILTLQEQHPDLNVAPQLIEAMAFRNQHDTQSMAHVELALREQDLFTKTRPELSDGAKSLMPWLFENQNKATALREAAKRVLSKVTPQKGLALFEQEPDTSTAAEKISDAFGHFKDGRLDTPLKLIDGATFGESTTKSLPESAEPRSSAKGRSGDSNPVLATAGIEPTLASTDSSAARTKESDRKDDSTKEPSNAVPADQSVQAVEKPAAQAQQADSAGTPESVAASREVGPQAESSDEAARRRDAIGSLTEGERTRLRALDDLIGEAEAKLAKREGKRLRAALDDAIAEREALLNTTAEKPETPASEAARRAEVEAAVPESESSDYDPPSDAMQKMFERFNDKLVAWVNRHEDASYQDAFSDWTDYFQGIGRKEGGWRRWDAEKSSGGFLAWAKGGIEQRLVSVKRAADAAHRAETVAGAEKLSPEEKAGAKPKERPADTQAARDEFDAAAKAIHKRWTDPDKLNDFTEIVKDIGQLTYLATRAKMYEFRDYIRELAKHIDPALLRKYATEIETLWSNMAETERGKRFGLSKSEPVGLVLDEQSAESPSTGSTADEPPGETGDGSGESYSIKRRKVDEFHEKHSWDDVQKPDIPTMEAAQIQADELAQETMKSEPNFGYELMNRLLDDPLNASVSRLDVAVMQRLAAEAQVNYETAIEKLQEAQARNVDEKQIADLNRNAEDLHEKAKQIHEVGAIVSRTWHGVGMQLQAEFDRELNRLDMEREWSLADEGRPLDDEGKAALKRIAAEAKRLKDENARLAKELEESNVEAATQKAHADAVREVLKAEQERRKALEEELARERAKPGGHLVGGPSGGKPTVTRQPKARQNTQDAIARLRAKARELTFRKSAEFIPYSRYVELAPELIDVARAYISEKVATFQDFMDRLKLEAADMAKQYADDWKAVWDGTKLADITENIADQYDSENAATLTPIARELHRFVIERDGLGMNEAKKARHAVHEILKDFIPDLTITDTAKAMSGYDIYHPLNNNRTEVVRREQNARTGILLNIGEIWRTGHAKARGQERTPSSDEQRELVKVRNQAKKRHGKVTDEEKAGQLKSTLASMKTTLRNRIKDLQKEIAAHKRKIKTPATSPTDTELQDLQKQLAEVQTLHEEAFGKRKLTDQQRQAILEKGLDRRYEELVALRESGKLWPPNGNAAVKSTPAIEAKRARNAAELAAIDELRLQSPEHAARVLTERINQLDSQITKMEKDLADNKLYSDPSTDTKIDNETTLFQKDRLADLKAEREDRRHSSGEFQLREEARYVRQQLKTIAAWKTRIANEEFGPRPPKPERVRTEAIKKNDIELEKLREEFAKGKRDRWLKNRHPMKKLLDRAVLHPISIVRKALTSFDASLIGRQGWFAWVTHPILTAKAARQGFAQNPVKNWSIFPSVDDYHRTVAAIKNDPVLVDVAKRTGINLTEISGGLNREEGFQEVPDWVNKVPGLGGSERSASAFMDTLRTSLAVQLVTRLAQKRAANGEPALTKSEMRVIGHFVNGMTGRQSLSQKADSSKWLARIFFSARWKASRMLWPVAGNVWLYENKWLGTGEGVGSDVRRAMLGEWVKQVVGVGTVMGITGATLFLAYGAGGPDKEWEFVSDETSPKFGQFRIGDNWIDFTTGVGALISFPIRLWRGEKKGKWRSKKIDRYHEAGRFLQGNLAPAPGAVADEFFGSMDGTVVGSKEWYANRLTPLIVQDVQSLSNKDHIPTSAVWDTLAFVGAGVKADRPNVVARADAADELRSLHDRAQKSTSPQRRTELEQKLSALLHEHLKNAVVKELKADLSTAKTDAKSQSIAARIKEAKSSTSKTTLSKESAADFQKEKYDIALYAATATSAESKMKKYFDDGETVFRHKSDTSDAGINASRDLIQAMTKTDDEQVQLLMDAWKSVPKNRNRLTKGYGPARSRLLDAAEQYRQRQPGK